MKIYFINELQESRIYYDKNPPHFMRYIIYILFLAVISFFVWAGLSTKTEVIKASGVFTTLDKIQVMSDVQGRILEINVSEGARVNEGETIIIVDNSEAFMQIKALQSQIDFLQNYIDNYQRLINAIVEFDCSEININVNPFSKNNEELQFFLMYESLWEQIKEISVTKDDTDKIGETINKTEEELNKEYKNILDMNLLQNIQQKSQYEYEVVTKMSQKNAYEDNLPKYSISAIKSGIIHFNADITKGMFIQAGVSLFSIAETLTEENIIIEALVPVSQRSFLESQQDVEVAVHGILQQDYGVLKGKVVSIGSDSLTDTESGNSFYKIIIKPQTISLNKAGKTLSLENGMTAESRIKYDEMTWLKWIGKQMGIIK